ncbi:restriction endonuclease subunit S [Janthinobacterium lividum]
MQNKFIAIPLGDIAHIDMGQSPDSSSVFEGSDVGVPFLQGNADFGAIHPTPRFSCISPMKVCQVGDILLSVRAPVGALNIADRVYCIGRGLAAIRIVGMQPTLTAQLLSAATSALRRVAQGTTFEAISKSDLERLVVIEPPRVEQRQLTLVIDTLDTTIRQTEAIIEKLKQVKQGLLHDLLTRGIDANGELRPQQSQAPHLYKDSPLGWVPIEWQVQRMANYMSTDITYGIVQAGPHIDGGIPYVRTGDMSGDSLCKASMLCTTRRIADAFRRSEVRAGDIVMAIRATVGKVLMVPNELNGANLTQGTARLAPNQQSDPVFILWAIRHERAQNSIASEIKGTTFAEITLAALREVLLAAPVNKDEQFEIGKRMAACESRIFQERRHLEKLKAQKSGVMDDLLTGRVRVTPLLNSQSVQS